MRINVRKHERRGYQSIKMSNILEKQFLKQRNDFEKSCVEREKTVTLEEALKRIEELEKENAEGNNAGGTITGASTKVTVTSPAARKRRKRMRRAAKRERRQTSPAGLEVRGTDC